MINELYGLVEALEKAKIGMEYTHAKYNVIPTVSKAAPCIHIIFDHGKVYKVESIEKEQAAGIRRYGSNQGTFPALNLAPLYRLTDEAEKKMISELIKGKTTDFEMQEIRQLCRENNWGKKFGNKYRICMENVPREMTELFCKAKIAFPPLFQLIEETRVFTDAAELHIQLEKVALAMLEQKTEIALALRILFHLGKQGESGEEDYGTLSVVLDSKKLIMNGLSVATAGFTTALNRKLLEAEAAMRPKTAGQEIDAFGQAFELIEEPMPKVKLAAGFDVSLRTMFRGQPCQNRYGKIENATYPISKEMSFKLQSSLAWLSSAEHEKVTWLKIDKDEVLFAYPETIHENQYSMVNFYKNQTLAEKGVENETGEKSRKKVFFESAAKAFISELKEMKKPGTDPMSDHIKYFILKKIDKAKTKVIFTYNTSPAEIECCSEEWVSGCKNLPAFIFGQPAPLFPLEVSSILNQIWRLDGKLSTERFKAIPRYYGIQVFFGESLPIVRRNLFILMKNVANLAPYLGKTGLPGKKYKEWPVERLCQTWDILALMGLFLYQLGIRKEKYMQGFPYLFGQLLKVSDSLHEMYCRVVRDNDMPNTLVGSGVYSAGAEQPYKTLALLGQRMNPYITWAKSYRGKEIQKKNEESWRAGWYLTLYERIASQLCEVWENQTRFNEEEKAQYFIGYLAAFPKKEK